MTGKQILMKLLYPLILRVSKKKAQLLKNKSGVKPKIPFYNLQLQLNNGALLQTESLKGKKVMIVNTASNCGFTPQYKDLQELYEQHKDQLVIIGFPSNDFKEQEKGDDTEIQQFCQVNFGVTFPLAKKSVVVEGDAQNEIFQWLTKKDLNGWNSQQPKWNFSKYLINEQGVLTHYFDPGVSPTSPEVVNAIENKLG